MRSSAGFALTTGDRPRYARNERPFNKSGMGASGMFTRGMEFDLGEDVNALRDMVHRWSQDRIKPIAAQVDQTNAFPNDLWTEMGELGLLGITVPEEFGGAGMGYLAHVIAVEEIARASASVSLSYGAHSNLCVNQIKLNGTDEQRRRYLPDLCSGKAVGALAMSEEGAGSDVVGMKLRAEKKNDRYVLNGSKYWITNAPDAHTLVVYAKTDPDAGSKGITAFIVERGMAGFSTSPHFDKLGMRGSNTGELIFENCEIPFENVLGEEGRGVRVLMSGLDYERLVLSGIGTGIMAACLDEVMPYVRDRKQFGQPIGSFQLMQGKIADMYVALNTARAYVYEVAKACDAGKVTRQDAAGAVLYASEQAMVQAHQAVQALGGAGFLNDSTVSRLFRDAKLMEIGAGTSEIRRMLIGRELMGLV
jgi:isovaleryl-CoA dehydrogenase